MEFDVAVLGGGPAGYTAAIRAAQLGARVACIEKESELGGTCLRVGCIPTKAWVQTAHALHAAKEIDPKLGVNTGEPTLDFEKANEWKAAVVKQMTGGVASLFKANGVTSFEGTGRFENAGTIVFDKADVGVTFSKAIVATGSYPMRPPIRGLGSARCVDSTGLLAQTEIPRRLVVLGGGIIGCEFASIFERFGSEVTIIEMLDSLIPQEDSDATNELRKAFARRGIVVHLGKEVTQVNEVESGLVVNFGGETVECDLMLVSVGRAPLVEEIGLELAGVTFDPRTGIETDGHRRTSVPHIYAAGDVAGYWQLAHTSFREGEIAAENATGHEIEIGDPAVPRPIYTDPEIAGVGLTEAEARELHGDDVAVGRFPWVANARAVMMGETTGWVKTIHETTYGELLGVVIVGPHATDLIEAAVVALDAEATVETVADGMAPHPTLSEAFKEAGLVALERPIHIPLRRTAWA
ncbi:MAG: dihydrolipoyl dehydrogenase [Gaiellaceae bacterium]